MRRAAVRVFCGLERSPPLEVSRWRLSVLAWRVGVGGRWGHGAALWASVVPLAVQLRQGEHTRWHALLVPFEWSVAGWRGEASMDAEYTDQPRGPLAEPGPTAEPLSTSGFGALAAAFGRLDAAARADSTVGTPRQLGQRTLVPLAEVHYGGGFGLGGGSAPRPDGEQHGDPEGSGLGGGGGFGGRLRPVAVVDVGPDGARVRPVVDVTLLGLALAGLALAAVLRWPRRRG